MTRSTVDYWIAHGAGLSVGANIGAMLTGTLYGWGMGALDGYLTVAVLWHLGRALR